jgi:hypothetical protein
MSHHQPEVPAPWRLAPRVAAAAMLTVPSARLPRTQTQAGQWGALLLAMACTLVIVALFLTPVWLPSWRRWQAGARTRRSDVRPGSQRFADAVARGDFEQAEAEAAHLLDGG